MVITCPGVCEIRVDLNKTQYLKSQHIQTLIPKGTKGKGPAGTKGMQSKRKKNKSLWFLKPNMRRNRQKRQKW